MKSLSLSRPVVILMVGAPGSGKSFFARQFGNMFHSPVVSYDMIRTELFQDATYSSDEEKIVSRIATLMSDELFKSNRSFVIDGGMSTRAARHEMTRQAKTQGYDTLIVWVQIDARSSLIRSQKRNHDREYDEFNQPLSAEQYAHLSRQFVAPHSRDSVLVISGKHTFATQARMILKRLAPPARDASSPEPTPRGERPLPTQSTGSSRRLTIQ